MKKLFIGALVIGLLIAGAAIAEVPGLFIVSPNGLEQINVLGLGPQIETIMLAQARDAVGYQKSLATSGTLTFGAQSVIQIGGSSTIAALTIALSPTPFDGQQNCFYTKPAITALTLSVSSGQTLNDAITAGSATTRYCYLYSLSNTTWDRTQ